MRAILLLALCGLATAATAQTYPGRPVTLVLPFPPGGIDGVVRLVTQKAGERLRQPIVVQNKPGASGIIAAEAVKVAQADGYTLLLGHAGTHAVNPSLYAKLPYDPARDFDPVIALFSTAHVLVVPPDSPAKSVAELVALAGTRAQGLSFASQGVGTGGHLLGEMFKVRSGARLTHVPYKGTAPAQADVMAGRVDLYFDGIVTSLPHIRSGKLRALAAATKSRPRQLPDLPTMAELGFPGVDLDFWFAVFAPAGTPTGARDTLRAAFAAALRDADIVAKLDQLALDVLGGDDTRLATLVRVDAERLGKVVRDAGVRAD